MMTAKRSIMPFDIKRLSQLSGIKLVFPKTFPIMTLQHMRFLTALQNEMGDEALVKASRGLWVSPAYAIIA
jgi:2-hydroxychromene-2-carboxylate isomerase